MAPWRRRSGSSCPARSNPDYPDSIGPATCMRPMPCWLSLRLGSGAPEAPTAAEAMAASRGLPEEVASAIDVRREIQRVLASQPLGQLGVAPLERFDDLQMIDDAARGAIALRDGGATHGPYMQQQVARGVHDRLRAAQANHLRVKGDVGIRVLTQMLTRRGVLKLIEQMAQLGDLIIWSLQGRKS